MKTLYIDVYFMINFTVDVLAVFIAARMTHTRINIKKMLLSGIVGAIFAIAELFIDNKLLHFLLSLLFLLVICYISCKRSSTARKAKFLLSFYIAAFLISGIVNFIYGILDRYIGDFFEESTNSTNRKAIIFSLIILLIIGVLRLFIMMFSESITEKSAKISIELNNKFLEVEALVDTGNLVKDPMNMNPVIFLKRHSAEKIVPSAIIDLHDIDSLGNDFRKRIRLIPVTRNSETHVMMGIRVDKVLVHNGKFKEEINATIAIDKEEGTYGGYYALAPYVSVCRNV